MPTTEHVTVLFTDLVGSTELSSALEPEAADELRRKHFSALRQAIASVRWHRGEEPRRRAHGRLSCVVGGPRLCGGHAAGRPSGQRRCRATPWIAGRSSCRRGDQGDRRLLRRPGHRGRPTVRQSRGGSDPGRRSRARRRPVGEARTPSPRSGSSSSRVCPSPSRPSKSGGSPSRPTHRRPAGSRYPPVSPIVPASG